MKITRKLFNLTARIITSTLLLTSFAFAQDDELLPADEAFAFSLSPKETGFDANWVIAPGYYMYQDKLSFSLKDQSGTPIDISYDFPKSKTKDDPLFGSVEVYVNQVTFDLPLSVDVTQGVLTIKGQGCNEPIGVCYPPITHEIPISFTAISTANSQVITSSTSSAQGLADTSIDQSLDSIAQLRDLMGVTDAQDELLSPDEAFKVSAIEDIQGITVRFEVADGYYLYQNKLNFGSASHTLTSPDLPKGEIKDDEYFGKSTVYKHPFDVLLQLARTSQNDTLKLDVGYQGCAEQGVCYPPQKKTFSVSIPSLIAQAQAQDLNPSQTTANYSTPTNLNAAQQPTAPSIMVSEQDKMAQTLKSGNTWLMLLIFFGAGLLLAFTPCVFPMVPILSGIIVGQGENISTRKAFMLSLIYVLAMALTYTVVGILVGLSGQNIQAWFQNPWIIGFFVAIFVALSFSMFGFYELQMPASLQNKLNKISSNREGGNILGVAIMGFLSALIVGPCITAPLVGALIYISDTGDALLGGLALFSLSMGMGTPLLLIGASAGKFLPKAGAWMDAVKAVFGVMLLGLGIWMLERVAPAWATMSLWASLLIISAIYLGALENLSKAANGWRKLWKGIGFLLLAYGIILLIGLSSGNRNVFQPLRGLGGSSNITNNSEHLVFTQIKGVDGLNIELEKAKAAGKAVMLDFYADWCVSCKEMEVFTFSDPAVQQALQNVVLLQADVTPNDALDTALYQHFSIIGPPSIMFFDTLGVENKAYRVVGFMPADKFSNHVKRALN